MNLSLYIYLSTKNLRIVENHEAEQFLFAAHLAELQTLIHTATDVIDDATQFCVIPSIRACSDCLVACLLYII